MVGILIQPVVDQMVKSNPSVTFDINIEKPLDSKTILTILSTNLPTTVRLFEYNNNEDVDAIYYSFSHQPDFILSLIELWDVPTQLTYTPIERTFTFSPGYTIKDLNKHDKKLYKLYQDHHHG